MSDTSKVVYGHQAPRMEHVPEYDSDAFADRALRFVEACGVRLFPWQKHVLRNSLLRRDGKWAAQQVGLSVPRQNGKSELLTARILIALFLVEHEKLTIVSAHKLDSAIVMRDRILKLADAPSSPINRMVRKRVMAKGSEALVADTGNVVRFAARTNDEARGKSPDLFLLDEAQNLTSTMMAAIMPTLSARPDPQLWYVGTPPAEHVAGDVFGNVRRAGLKGSETLLWSEWSADPDLENGDIEAIRQANPSLGHMITLPFVMTEHDTMPDTHFGRERLGKWDNAASQFVIHPDTWLTLADPDISPEDIGEVALAIDAAPDRSVATISISGWTTTLADDGTKRDVPFVSTVQSRNGVGWAASFIASRWERGDVRAVIIDSASAASSIIEPLREKGVLVTATSAQQYAAACGQFYDACMDGGLRHAAQPPLNSAVAAARKRKLGDSWAWNRKDASSDITPLVSCTLALWGLTSTAIAKPKPKVKAPSISRTFYGFN